MKTLGLIGGISWVSTIDYYKYINEGINKKLGGLEFAHCIIHSFNYGEVKRRNDAGDFAGMLRLLIHACSHLKQGGAEALVLCANTMHMYAADVEQAVGLPVIHIAKATAEVINKQGLATVALLGTKFTMEQDFFKDKLAAQGIKTVIPGEEDRAFIHYTIFEELGRGIVSPESKARYIGIIEGLAAEGAQGAILGCTEIPLLISQDDVSIPVFDTTRIHADAAVRFSLGN
jgi:aspartate racemase